MAQKHVDYSELSLPQKIVRFLFRELEGFPFKPLELLKFLSAFVLMENRTILDGFFKALADKISALPAGGLSEEKKEAILYCSLSYLAFSDPTNNEKIEINNIEYTIERIPLTSGWFSGTSYAYGLKTNIENQPSYLIFKGTTFPTNGGFLAGLLADTRPHGAVGAWLYQQGKERLQAWITSESTRTNKNVICTGQSLGAAMSLHCHIHQPNIVDFYVINPPSLSSMEERIYTKHVKTDNENTYRTLKVLHHFKDFIFNAGSHYLPPNTKLISHGGAKDHTFFAHAKAPLFTTDSPELVPKLYDNSSRKRTVINILWKMVKPILFLFVLACHLIALPLRLMTQIVHKISECYSEKGINQTSSSSGIKAGSSTQTILAQVDYQTGNVGQEQDPSIYLNPLLVNQKKKPEGLPVLESNSPNSVAM